MATNKNRAAPAAAPQPERAILDPVTARAVRECRAVIDAIEAGDMALIKFSDITDSEGHSAGPTRILTLAAVLTPKGNKR